jgi:hypothetical protein
MNDTVRRMASINSQNCGQLSTYGVKSVKTGAGDEDRSASDDRDQTGQASTSTGSARFARCRAASPAGTTARYAEAVKEGRGKGRVHATPVLSDVYSPLGL